jgi:L-lactate dehydrogenase complex protein LldG
VSARDRILKRLRTAQGQTQAPQPDVANWFGALRRKEDIRQRAARLRAALEASHAEVYDTNDADWPQLLLRIAAEKGLRTLLIGDGTPHGAALEALQPESPKLVRYDRPADDWRDSLFDDIDAGLTLAKSAIAETGSLIVWPDAHEPRLLSLVPPLHFVLVDAANIHPDFHAAMTAERWSGALPTNALLISGPSKTADIQQTLAYGAHGPRELVVLLRHAEGDAA